MALDPKPGRTYLSSSFKEGSTASHGPRRTQLSAPDGVEMDVSTAALDRSMLMAATTAPFSPMVAGGEPPSDAQIMLRVRAGDQ